MSFASASGVSFSQELLDEIVDAVALLDAKDLPSVKSCSLASKSFLSRSRYHIFAHITLYLSDHEAQEDAESPCPQSDAERFIINALHSTPRLALLVRSVTLTNHGHGPANSSGSFAKWRIDDLEKLISSDPHLAPLFSRLTNVHTLKLDHLDLGYFGDDPFEDGRAAQVLASFSAFFGNKPITTLVLQDVGFRVKQLLIELLKGFRHLRTLDFTAEYENRLFSIEASLPTGIPLVPQDGDYTPIPLQSLIIGLSEVSDAELRAILRDPYPLSLSQLEHLEFRDRTIHDRSHFEDIEQALEMTRSSLKTSVFNLYYIETKSPQVLSLQHLTDVRIKIHHCRPPDSVIRDEDRDQRYLPRHQWRFWVRCLTQAEAYCMRHFTITVVLYFHARVPISQQCRFSTPQSSRSLGNLGFGPPSGPFLWVNGPNVNDLTALREALMRPQFQHLESVTVLIDFNLTGSRFHPGLLPPRLQEFRDAFQPLVEARRYTFTLSVIGDQTPPPDELLSQPCTLYQREDLPDSEAEEEEEKQAEIRRLHEIIKPTSALNLRNVMIQRWINLDPERNRYKVEFEKWISQVPQATQDQYLREEKQKRKAQKAAAGPSKKKKGKKST